MTWSSDERAVVRRRRLQPATAGPQSPNGLTSVNEGTAVALREHHTSDDRRLGPPCLTSRHRPQRPVTINPARRPLGATAAARAGHAEGVNSQEVQRGHGKLGRDEVRCPGKPSKWAMAWCRRPIDHVVEPMFASNSAQGGASSMRPYRALGLTMVAITDSAHGIGRDTTLSAAPGEITLPTTSTPPGGRT
jgi:hypothetical protein